MIPPQRSMLVDNSILQLLAKAIMDNFGYTVPREEFKYSDKEKISRAVKKSS